VRTARERIGGKNSGEASAYYSKKLSAVNWRIFHGLLLRFCYKTGFTNTESVQFYALLTKW
jgi:hypothetical protein